MQMNLFQKSKRHTKIIGLLSVVTLFEYIDLMLYVHIAMILSDYFCTSLSSQERLLSNMIAISITFAGRALGCAIFMKFGDIFKRVIIIMIGAVLFIISHIVVANLSKEWYACAVLLICRVVHGLFSVGDGAGSRVYASENTLRSSRYAFVGLMDASARMGNVIALAAMVCVLNFKIEWRWLFIVLIACAVISSYLRIQLNDARELVDAKRRLKKVIKEVGYSASRMLKDNAIWKAGVSTKTVIAMFFVEMSVSANFFFVYIFFSSYLKYYNDTGVSDKTIAEYNLCAALLEVLSAGAIIAVTNRISALKIIKCKIWLFCLSIPVVMFIFIADNGSNAASNIFHMQLFYASLLLSPTAAYSAFYKHFPVFHRFRKTNLIFVSASMVTVMLQSMIMLCERFYHIMMFGFMFIIAMCFFVGVTYFERLSKKGYAYPDSKMWGKK